MCAPSSRGPPRERLPTLRRAPPDQTALCCAVHSKHGTERNGTGRDEDTVGYRENIPFAISQLGVVVAVVVAVARELVGQVERAVALAVAVAVAPADVCSAAPALGSG